MFNSFQLKGYSVQNWDKVRAFSCMALLNVLFITSVHASNQASMISSAYTQPFIEINLISALNHTNSPLKNEITKLYESQDFKLLWSNGENYNNNAKQLFKTIQHADSFGLNPNDYDYHLIQSFLDATSVDPKLISRSDVVFSHAYVKLASHVSHGKHIQASNVLKDQSILSTLSDATKNHSISATIENLQPKHNHYARLLNALQHYKNLPKELPTLQLNTRSLEFNERSPEIIKLRQLLHAFGDFRGNDLTNELFDEAVMVALSDFQLRHGLEPDGILGKRTVHELNVPINDRITQLEINLARSKTLPNSENNRYLHVNIPAYELYLHENGQTTFQTRVVVGKKKNKTPLLSSELKQVVINPYWNVPKSITQKEIIPAIQQDPQYLAKNNMKLFGRMNNKTYQLNPDAFDWNNIDPANTNFRVRQEPGVKNSLGQIKFLFPNRYSVYLHDTPAKNLFALPKRAFSHGCIRLQDPFGLAEAVLSSDGVWSKGDLMYLAKHNKRKTLTLQNPIPIHVTYMTAWADQHGIVHFRPDIYKRDSQFAANLYNASH